MAFNFPSLPAINQVHTEGDLSWIFDGASWESEPSISSTKRAILQAPPAGANQTITIANNNDSALTLKAAGGQTAAILKFLSSTSSVIGQVLADGRYRLPGNAINVLDAVPKQELTAAIAALSTVYVSLAGNSIIQNQNVGDIGLRTKGVAGQTGALAQWLDNASTVLASVAANGAMYTKEQLDVDDYTTGGVRLEKTGIVHITDENRASANLPANGLIRLAPDASVIGIRMRLDTGHTANPIYIEDEGGTGKFRLTNTLDLILGDLTETTAFSHIDSDGYIEALRATGSRSILNSETFTAGLYNRLENNNYVNLYAIANNQTDPGFSVRPMLKLETLGAFTFPSIDFYTQRTATGVFNGSLRFFKNGVVNVTAGAIDVDGSNDTSAFHINISDGGAFETALQLRPAAHGGCRLEGTRYRLVSSLPGSPDAATVYFADDGVYKGGVNISNAPHKEVVFSGWTNGSDDQAVHNLGRLPYHAVAVLRCKATNNNYAVGDEIYVCMNGFVNSTQGMQLSCTASQVGIHIFASGMEVANRTTAATFTVIPSQWDIVVKAW